MATSAAIAPLPIMPTSSVFCMRWLVSIAPMTPAAAARVVTTTISAERPSAVPSVEPGVDPNQPQPQDQDAEAEDRHRVARDRPRLAVRPVLALAGAEQEQCGEGAGR